MPRTTAQLQISALLALMPAMAGCLAEAFVATSDGKTGTLEADAMSATASPATASAPEPAPATELSQPMAAMPDALPPGPSAIRASAYERVSFLNGVIGDLDHDGFDDFVVSAQDARPPRSGSGFVPVNVSYLFYGRADFAPQLSTADADAAFRGNQIGLMPLGDVNGDDRDDFAVSTGLGARIVLGDSARLQGDYAVDALGLGWHSDVSEEEARGYPSVFDVVGAGDLDGDGFDEIAVRFARPIDTFPGFVGTNYLVFGRAEALPSGVFDPRWAGAVFAPPPPLDPSLGGVELSSVPLMGADYDGDGYSDVLAAYGQTDVSIFYGGPGVFAGLIAPEQAAATLTSRFSDALLPFTRLSDIDGDGSMDLMAPTGPMGISPGLAIVYGRANRWSGRVVLDSDLLVLPPERDVGTGDQFLAGIVGGDVDGDGNQDIVVSEVMWNRQAEPSAVFVIRGDGHRLTGVVRLSDAEVLKRGTVTERVDPNDPNGATYLDNDALGDSLSIGDINGDGSADVLAGAPGTTPPYFPESYAGGTVHLIPGAPATPQ